MAPRRPGPARVNGALDPCEPRFCVPAPGRAMSAADLGLIGPGEDGVGGQLRAPLSLTMVPGRPASGRWRMSSRATRGRRPSTHLAAVVNLVRSPSATTKIRQPNSAFNRVTASRIWLGVRRRSGNSPFSSMTLAEQMRVPRSSVPAASDPEVSGRRCQPPWCRDRIHPPCRVCLERRWLRPVCPRLGGGRSHRCR